MGLCNLDIGPEDLERDYAGVGSSCFRIAAYAAPNCRENGAKVLGNATQKDAEYVRQVLSTIFGMLGRVHDYQVITWTCRDRRLVEARQIHMPLFPAREV